MEGIYESNKTAGELALAMEEKHDIALEETFYNLNTFLQKGYLDEEPEPPST